MAIIMSAMYPDWWIRSLKESVYSSTDRWPWKYWSDSRVMTAFSCSCRGQKSHWNLAMNHSHVAKAMWPLRASPSSHQFTCRVAWPFFMYMKAQCIYHPHPEIHAEPVQCTGNRSWGRSSRVLVNHQTWPGEMAEYNVVQVMGLKEGDGNYLPN